MQEILRDYPNLSLIEGAADDLVLDQRGEITGLKTLDGQIYQCRAVVLTTGTFLRGLIHRGEEKIPAGRVGRSANHRVGRNAGAA